MGVLDKKIISAVGFIAALLFIVAAIVGVATDDGDYDAADYILLVAGILAIIYSLSMFQGTSFVRKLCGIFLIIGGILFIAMPFAGDSAQDVLGAAILVTAVATVLDFLALWVSRIYGAMYVTVILAIVVIVMGAMVFYSDDDIYPAVGLVFIGIWFVMLGWVYGFVKPSGEKKTREVVETPVSEKKDKPQAQNKKATPKAKPKEEPAEPVKEEPKAEEPKEEPKEEPQPEPEPEPAKEEPAEPVKEEPKAEEPQPEEPKKEEIAPAKATGDFMQKLMSSRDAANAMSKKEEPAEPVVEEPKVEEPQPEPEPEPEPAKEEPVSTAIEEPVQAKDETVFAAGEPDWGDVSRDSTVDAAEEEEELGEDIYTDNSPEALVRRAAWNKGLRCRRDYGEMHIPVAFIKGHVAVFVEPKDADTTLDDKLRAEGWTVFRYDEAEITDGLAQGEEIAAAVKANARAAKKKSKK